MGDLEMGVEERGLQGGEGGGRQEKYVGAEAEEKEEEEEEGFLGGMAVLDFDMLCSTVALQTQGKWRKLEREEEQEDDFDGNGGAGGGVLRMWEGDVLDCCEDRRISVDSACCPCYRFGKNMRRAGFGPCFVQGIVYCFIAVAALLTFIAFVVTKRHYFLYLAVAFTVSVAMYLGFFRSQMRKKFNIRGGDSFLDDCIYHLFCPCCTLCQESRTLEMNNVQDGTWHGRGDTICVGSYREGHNAIFELHPPPLVTTKLSDSCSMQKSEDAIDQSS